MKKIIFKIVKGIILIFSLILFPFTKKETSNLKEKKSEKIDIKNNFKKTNINETSDDDGEEFVKKKYVLKELGVIVLDDEEVIIEQLEDFGFAKEAGLKKNDILISLNDIKIKNNLEKIEKIKQEDVSVLEYKRCGVKYFLFPFLENGKSFHTPKKEGKVFFKSVPSSKETSLKEDNRNFKKEEKKIKRKDKKTSKKEVKNNVSFEKTIENECLNLPNEINLSKEVVLIFDLEEKVDEKEKSVKEELPQKIKKKVIKKETIKEKNILKKENIEEKKFLKKENVKKKEELTKTEECYLIAKKIEDNQKEGKTFCNKKEEIYSLLLPCEKLKINLFPFSMFKRRMVRKIYKSFLLSNNLIKIRRVFGDYADYNYLDYFDLLNKKRRLELFEYLTFDNLYNISLVRNEIMLDYKDELNSSKVCDILNRLDIYEKRVIGDYQRFILKKRERQKIFVKK